MIGPPFGLRLYTCSDYTPVVEHRLAAYVRPDILRTGGADEIK